MFLKPYVVRTNRKLVKGENISILESRHEQLVPACTHRHLPMLGETIIVWMGERVVNEWMKWSGRQQRPEAVWATDWNKYYVRAVWIEATKRAVKYPVATNIVVVWTRPPKVALKQQKEQ
jgi:hypothetical protein